MENKTQEHRLRREINQTQNNPNIQDRRDHNESFIVGSNVERDGNVNEKTVELRDVINFFDRFLANENITARPGEMDLFRTALIVNKGILNLDDSERGDILMFLNILATTDRMSDSNKNRYFIVNLESSRDLIESLKFQKVFEKVHRHGLLKPDAADRKGVHQRVYGTGGKEAVDQEKEQIEVDLKDIDQNVSSGKRHNEKEIQINLNSSQDENRSSNAERFKNGRVFKTVNLSEITKFFDKFIANETIRTTLEDIDAIRIAVITYKNNLNLDDRERATLLEFLEMLVNKNRGSNRARIGGHDRFFLINLESSRNLIENLKFRNVLEKISMQGLLKKEMNASNEKDMKYVSNESENVNSETKEQTVSNSKANGTADPNESFAEEPENRTVPRRTHVQNIHNKDKTNMSTPSLKSVNMSKSPLQPKNQDTPPKNGTGVPKLFLIYGNPCDGDVLRLEPDKYVNDTYYVLDNGRLYYPYVGKAFSTARYCMEYFVDEDHVMPLLCFNAEGQEELEQSSEEIKLLYVLGKL